MVDRGKNVDVVSNLTSSSFSENAHISAKQRSLGWLADLLAKVAKKDKQKPKSTKSAKSSDKSAAKIASVVSWDVVVNNGNVIPPPGTARRSLQEVEEKTFSSYNAASVNAAKDVVFRARSTGEQNKEGGPKTGIYTRRMSEAGSFVIRQASRGSTVPYPNNIVYGETFTAFTEFPSFPRIALSKFHISTRATHQPVWKYFDESGVETRTGNTGLYFSLQPSDETESDTSSTLYTAIPKLGLVPEFSDQFQVPHLTDGDGNVLQDIPFDVFPGSPSIDDFGMIAFKGNYAVEGVGMTGVFYRKLDDDNLGGTDNPLYVIAYSDTVIPGCAKKFGSTATPSIADGNMVFRGVDDEENPTCGGIYEAPLQGKHFPQLKPLVQIGDHVVDANGKETPATFTRFGEGLSYDGKAVAFWAAWGDAMVTLTKCCPEHGNKDRRKYCMEDDPNTKNGTMENIGCMYQEVQVPAHQGFFVYQDGKGDKLRLVKETFLDEDGIGTDLLNWNYSGKPPGAGPKRSRALEDSDAAEPPRWRFAAFVALMSKDTVAYKMTTVTQDSTTSGIYTGQQGAGVYTPSTILKTGDLCTAFDGLAVVEGSGEAMTVESLAIEREAFRNKYLCISIACGTLIDSEEDDDEGDWGGIYCANMQILNVE
ncbi:hypothetical protein ACHAWO_010809 [Cyclotella atomus]|uniref:Uncharacterized protein n=1 Tax=Cyclotella atomus TaxID=382360 RepID=A0ABD3NC19_9STRA